MQAVAATEMAAADHMLNFDVIAELPCFDDVTWQARADGGRACAGGTRYATKSESWNERLPAEMNTSVRRSP
jgi:hypothetical protein